MSMFEKIRLVMLAKAEMDSSKVLNADAAKYYYLQGRDDLAKIKIERAAQYCWGFNRPEGWAV